MNIQNYNLIYTIRLKMKKISMCNTQIAANWIIYGPVDCAINRLKI